MNRVDARVAAKPQPRLIAWFIIGNSSSEERDRRIGWDLKRIGWHGFVRTWAEPAIQLGFPAIQLHNPGGTLAGEEMQPDQFVSAQEAGMDWITRDFVSAWKPITARVQVIAYMGMLPGHERMEALLDRKDHVGFLRTLTDAYQIPLEANMGIAFDALHDVNERDWPLQVYRLFTSMGVPTWVETAPNVRDTVLYDANFQIVNYVLERAQANKEPWLAPLDKLTGEKIVLLAEPPKGQTWKDWRKWLGPYVARWLDEGWSVALNPAGMIEEKLNPQMLIDPHRRGTRGPTRATP
ncbi:MAG: hypothetical protein SFZ23_00705 [Planctomycetota bacterium]|nr:hypothetical protein [Planctomycetota bacterium]